MNIVEIKNETAFADSLQIAEHFGKQHRNVTRAIEKAITDTNSRLKIEQSNYTNERGKKYKLYLLDRDAFSFIVMGFTGKAATEWKLKYIEAFNKMESIIREKQSTDWQLTRHNGKMVRRKETDAIRQFIEYAESQGSRNGYHYYKHFTEMVHKAVGIKNGERDNLTPAMLAHVATFEDQVSSQLFDLMGQKHYYKEIYQEVKAKISLIATMMIMPNDKYLPSKKQGQAIEMKATA